MPWEPAAEAGQGEAPCEGVCARVCAGAGARVSWVGGCACGMAIPTVMVGRGVTPEGCLDAALSSWVGGPWERTHPSAWEVSPGVGGRTGEQLCMLAVRLQPVAGNGADCIYGRSWPWVHSMGPRVACVALSMS